MSENPEPARLSADSLHRMKGVHADLAAVVVRAAEISAQSFLVLEGVRSHHRHEGMLQAGTAQPRNNRFVTGHAVDLAIKVDGEMLADGPLYALVAVAMKAAAAEQNILINWGGDQATAKDPRYFALNWEAYPDGHALR